MNAEKGCKIILAYAMKMNIQFLIGVKPQSKVLCSCQVSSLYATGLCIRDDIQSSHNAFLPLHFPVC